MAHLSLRPPGRHFRRLLLLAFSWCMMTGGVFSGCRGLFTPAIPEPPTQPPFIPNYRSPENTLNTMKLGIAAKGPQGAAAWQDAFPDSLRPEDGPGYHQFFDAADLSVFVGAGGLAPGDWRRSQERDFYLSLLGIRLNDAYKALFEPWVEKPDPNPEPTQAVLHRHYQVLANSPDGNSSLIIAIGYADLTFTKVTGDRWLITRWDDHVDPAIGANPIDPYQLSLGRRRLESTR